METCYRWCLTGSSINKTFFFLLTIRNALCVPHSCVPTSTNLADDPPIILEQLINIGLYEITK